MWQERRHARKCHTHTHTQEQKKHINIKKRPEIPQLGSHLNVGIPFLKNKREETPPHNGCFFPAALCKDKLYLHRRFRTHAPTRPTLACLSVAFPRRNAEKMAEKMPNLEILLSIGKCRENRSSRFGGRGWGGGRHWSVYISSKT